TSGRSPTSTRYARRSRPTAGAPAGCSAAFRCRIVPMSESRDAQPKALVLVVSVPVEGELRIIASDIAAQVGEYLGQESAASVNEAVERAASQVLPAANGEDISFEFRQLASELCVRARCGSRTSEVRCPLPA